MENINEDESIEMEKRKMEFKLTKQHIQELQRAFCCFENGDGKIPNRRLGEVLRALGQNPTDVEIQDLINEYDYNSNGTIEFHELVDVMKLKFLQSDAESELRHAFRVFDSEERGWIRSVDVKHVMVHLDDKLTEAETDAMLSEAAAKNNSERIDYEQFAELINLKEKKKKKMKMRGTDEAGIKGKVDEVEPRVWCADV